MFGAEQGQADDAAVSGDLGLGKAALLQEIHNSMGNLGSQVLTCPLALLRYIVFG